jgi:DNA-binding response OmpR family regulator
VNEANEAMVSFIIRDTGPGIPEALRSRIFDRFYRLEQHDRGSVEGSGIGLSLVKELTELHGGGVNVVEPKLEGVDSSGSEFIVQLPMGFQHFEKGEFSTQFSELPTPNLIQTTRSEVSKRNHSNHTQKTLLLVEDVHDMREYIADHFRSEYNVMTAGDGQQGWDILQHKHVDIVLTDLMMPIMDGLELLENIRSSEQLKHLPVLMLTARSDREDRNAALTHQASDYLAKPFDSDELVLRIRNLAQGAAHKNNDEPTEVPVSADQKFLEEAKRFVLEHLGDTLFDTKQLASALNMSKPTFHRHLDKAANTTPAAFIRDIRLDQAHQLIEAQTYRTIAEVAFAVGFSSPGYFSRLYKQRYG